ncbi:MAG: hydroxymethylglutaryl-CoA lyase [Negativicutes bacterium]|nr:hydroxymethylglutaryl-CoA lyase [Negativicutes bacterium]
MELPEKVTICEVGLRDGLQNEKRLFSLPEKLSLLNSIIKSGIKIIEIGSFVSPKAVPAMADTDKLAKLMPKSSGIEFRALVANLKGVQRAHECGVTKTKLTVSASEAHCLSNLNKLPAEIIHGFKDCAEYARQHKLQLSGAISTAFGCPFQGKVPFEQVENVVEELLALGITELSLSDTTGMANPKQVYELCSILKAKYPQVKWILHFHNTRGMALANILAGMQAGITTYDGSFAGLGGCPFAPGASGNVATEDIVHMLQEMAIETNIDLLDAIETAKLAQHLAGRTTESFILKAGRCQDLVK